MSTAKSSAVDTFNGLLRGELSAIETYTQAIAKVDKFDGGQQLENLRQDHIKARDAIREHIQTNLHGTPVTSSGAWGTFAAAVEGTAKIFGDTAAMKALKEGEQHGIKDYETALADKNLGPKCHTLISASLLPPTRQHIAVLDSLMAAK